MSMDAPTHHDTQWEDVFKRPDVWRIEAKVALWDAQERQILESFRKHRVTVAYAEPRRALEVKLHSVEDKEMITDIRISYLDRCIRDRSVLLRLLHTFAQRLSEKYPDIVGGISLTLDTKAQQMITVGAGPYAIIVSPDVTADGLFTYIDTVRAREAQARTARHEADVNFAQERECFFERIFIDFEDSPLRIDQVGQNHFKEDLRRVIKGEVQQWKDFWRDFCVRVVPEGRDIKIERAASGANVKGYISIPVGFEPVDLKRKMGAYRKHTV